MHFFQNSETPFSRHFFPNFYFMFSVLSPRMEHQKIIENQTPVFFFYIMNFSNFNPFPGICSALQPSFWYFTSFFRGSDRQQQFEPRSHPQWGIVEVSNRLPNLSAKQSELTVRTKTNKKKTSAMEKTHPLRKKIYETVNLDLICPKINEKSALYFYITSNLP